jgi:hypothetical protein
VSALTPEDRAYHDALADAVKYGIHGEAALRYADHMRGSTWFAGRTLHYELADLRAEFWRSRLGSLLIRVTRWRP